MNCRKVPSQWVGWENTFLRGRNFCSTDWSLLSLGGAATSNWFCTLALSIRVKELILNVVNPCHPSTEEYDMTPKAKAASKKHPSFRKFSLDNLQATTRNSFPAENDFYFLLLSGDLICTVRIGVASSVRARLLLYGATWLLLRFLSLFQATSKIITLKSSKTPENFRMTEGNALRLAAWQLTLRSRRMRIWFRDTWMFGSTKRPLPTRFWA